MTVDTYVTGMTRTYFKETAQVAAEITKLLPSVRIQFSGSSYSARIMTTERTLPIIGGSWLEILDYLRALYDGVRLAKGVE